MGERGLPLAIAQAHGLGWGTDKAMAGRAVTPDWTPKYSTLPAATYPKGWFNGAAVALARERGWPRYLCVGVFDALALLAGGIPTAAAVLGVEVIRTEWLAGCKDLGEYWATHHTFPRQLAAHFADAIAADPFAAPAPPMQTPPPDERTRAALEAARLSVVSFAHLAEDLRDALPDDDAEAPYWRAVLLDTAPVPCHSAATP